MNETSQSLVLEKDCLEVLPLHFKVPEHYLPLSEFIAIANSTKAIIDSFNAEMFDQSLRYEILVLPPEAGTFKSKIGICILGVGTLWAFTNTDVGNGYIKGLTGHEAAYWSEKAGIATKDFLLNLNEETKKQKKVASEIMIECTKGFLEKENIELRKIGISKKKFRKAYEARNIFYQTCLNDSNISAIGFDNTDNFPIERSSFPQFIVDLPPTEDKTLQNWHVEIKHVKVTSPNWERGDDRHWKAKYDGPKSAFFIIEDEKFWKLVETNNLKPKIFDLMKVQWAFTKEAGRRTNIRVLKVLEFNGKKFGKALTGPELQKALKNYSIEQDDQPDLFDAA